MSIGNNLQTEEYLEDIEDGIDPDEDESITQPFDPELIRIETRSMTIDLLLQRIKYEELNLAPDFQRKGGIWNSRTKSRLIESLLVRIPLPAFYMDATNEDKWIVIDGLQRLTTLKEFVIDKDEKDKQSLRLSELEFLKLNGKSFDELPRNLQRRIIETQVTVYLIEKGTPPEVKFNMFKRINTGGLPLSLQEVRHALNQGKSTKFLEKLSKLPEFKKATTKSISGERMEDREFVLRFLAFIIFPYNDYNAKEFDSFLSDVMARINRMDEQSLANLEEKFKKSMIASHEIFGKYAFRKCYKLDAPRSLINKALFESWSVNLSKLTEEQIQILIERKDILIDKFITLMNDREQDPRFDSAISQGTADTKKVKRRFSAIEELIQEVLS
ncbi:DUF262 domain-containing protein [Pseudanabaena sp. UWO310]|uniref:DUF262 domain-containing protein n=1 Tax=Pseudanabaena sp. UWO310 TaxID=2480795 RepID=UPI00115A307B|nr:DUF262 domain-containing protein [Pseudanabaena sp. UWO310]TYQ27462.1 DUF262 domain-containing protein [Pseudanabaena sp. UWO310]